METLEKLEIRMAKIIEDSISNLEFSDRKTTDAYQQLVMIADENVLSPQTLDLLDDFEAHAKSHGIDVGF